ncbi:unnamed protein product [Ambrosiozyma monospora]|uniref:Unnamed protein product n=1 Tax=Ambrosiozyma monospora TaxID=43982 RepID=A0ACB5SZ73_AMBMO|nr:unnamed protein product [Ambrosiozyma monospora]
MSETSHISTTVKTITSNLPQEIQSLILQYVLVKYFTVLTTESISSSNRNPQKPDLGIESMMKEITSLLNYNPLLDGIISVALQQLELDESVFKSQYFGQLSEFILSKEVKVKTMNMSVNPSVDSSALIEPAYMKFLQFGCRNLICQCQLYDKLYNVMADTAHLHFVTSLNISLFCCPRAWFLDSIEGLTRLTDLKIMVSSSNEVEFLCEIMKDLNVWVSRKNMLKKKQMKICVELNERSMVPYEEKAHRCIVGLTAALLEIEDPSIILEFSLDFYGEFSDHFQDLLTLIWETHRFLIFVLTI